MHDKPFARRQRSLRSRQARTECRVSRSARTRRAPMSAATIAGGRATSRMHRRIRIRRSPAAAGSMRARRAPASRAPSRRDGPSLQPDHGADMKTRLANHTCRRAARASGRLSRYFIRYFPESQVRRQSSASASRIRPDAVTARGSKRTRSSALVLVAVTEITPRHDPQRVFDPSRREIPRHRGVTGVQAPVRQAQDLDGDDTQVPMQRDRLAVGPVRQFGIPSPAPAAASRVGKPSASPSASR